jgi:kumamolisin
MNYLNPRASASQITYKASDYTTIYSYPPLPTGPTTIGVISVGGGLYGTYNSRTCELTNGDVQRYWTTVCGIPITSCPRVLVVPIGVRNNPPGSGSDENTLDVTIIGACYPTSNLTIVLYIGANSNAGFTAALNAAINGRNVNGAFIKPSVISCSWGASEVSWGVYGGRNGTTLIQTSAAACRSLNTLFAKAVSEGTVICCASGDNGSSNGLPGKNVDFPASSPNVIACGGTSLVCPNLVWDSSTVEKVWNNNPVTSATGGGVSRLFTQPVFQSAAVRSAMRVVPDIAMNADPQTGVSIMFNGQLTKFGGTSMVAPAMAAFVARCPRPCTVAALYRVPSTCFNDITVGNNGAYKAGHRYDACTGRGSLRGTILVAKL